MRKFKIFIINIIILYSAIFISSFNSLKTLPEDGNSLFSENSQNISGKQDAIARASPET